MPAASVEVQPLSRAIRSSAPPPPPTANPTALPIASSTSALLGEASGKLPAAAAAPAMQKVTTGVARPSFKPLSTLSARLIRIGTWGSATTGAPRAASVGASAAATNAHSHGSKSNSRTATPKPSRIVSGRPISSSRTGSPASARNPRRLTREASEKSTSTSVTSTISRTVALEAPTSIRSSGSLATTSPRATIAIAELMFHLDSRRAVNVQIAMQPAKVATTAASSPCSLMSRSSAVGDSCDREEAVLDQPSVVHA